MNHYPHHHNRFDLSPLCLDIYIYIYINSVHHSPNQHKKMMRPLFLCAMFCVMGLMCLCSFAMGDSPVVDEVLFTTVQSNDALKQSIGFFGQFNSAEFMNSTSAFVQLKLEEALPENIKLNNATIIFRRHHCNCWVHQVYFTPNTADFQQINFPAPIEDEAMTFQGYIYYDLGSGPNFPLKSIPFSLTFKSTKDATKVHELKAAINAGRVPFASTFSISGPREGKENKAEKRTDTPVQLQLLLSNLNTTAMALNKPAYLQLRPIGRFQYQLPAGQTTGVTSCNLNGEDVPSTITVTTQFNTQLLIDLTGFKGKINEHDFLALRCDGNSAALYPTNAIGEYKFDLAFISYEFLDAERGFTGVGQFSAYNNVPDHIPQWATVSSSYIDRDVAFCQFDVDFQDRAKAPDPKVDMNKNALTGNESVGFYFVGLDKVAAETVLRVDVAPTVPEPALSIPFNKTLTLSPAGTSVDFVGARLDGLEPKLNRFANLTRGFSFVTFVDLTKAGTAVPTPEQTQCAMVLKHPNGDKKWEGTANYHVVGRPTMSKSFADKIAVNFNLVKEKATFDIKLTNILPAATDADLDVITQVKVTMPMVNWIFDGNYSTCAVNLFAAGKDESTKYPLAPKTAATADESTSAYMTFEFTDAMKKDFKPKSTVSITCPDVRLVSKAPQFEFVHESTLVNVVATTVNPTTNAPGSYSNTAVLSLKPSTKLVLIIFLIFISIMGLAALTMLICFTRCIYLTCTKPKASKNASGSSDPLLVNSNGYTLE